MLFISEFKDSVLAVHKLRFQHYAFSSALNSITEFKTSGLETLTKRRRDCFLLGELSSHGVELHECCGELLLKQRVRCISGTLISYESPCSVELTFELVHFRLGAGNTGDVSLNSCICLVVYFTCVRFPMSEVSMGLGCILSQLQDAVIAILHFLSCSGTDHDGHLGIFLCACVSNLRLFMTCLRI